MVVIQAAHRDALAVALQFPAHHAELAAVIGLDRKPAVGPKLALGAEPVGCLQQGHRRADRIGPIAGMWRSNFTAACLPLSRNSSRRAACRTGSRLSSCLYKCSARIRTPGSTSRASHSAR